MRTILWAVAASAAIAVAPPAGQPDWAGHPENNWVKQSPRPGIPAPPFGWEGSGDYDPHHRQWIHFGGHDGIPQGFPLFRYHLDTRRWQQHFPNTSPPGCCCVDGSNVFDIANRRFVSFPGAALGHGYQWSRGVKLKSSAVWLYDPAGNTWTNMRPPPYSTFLPREGLGSLNATATYDANHELALRFGGQGSAGGTNNLFAYDAYTNTLYRLDAANPPAPRDGMGLCYDSKNDCLVLFGSQYASDEKTWIYRYATNRWEGHDLTPHPPGKKLGTYSTIPRLAYDARNEVCLCLTWDTKTNQHETWVLDTARLRWTRMNPATEPEPSMSRSRNLGYSAEHNVFLLETSSKDGRGKAPQIWSYRYRNAPPRPAVPANLQVVTDTGKATLSWTACAPGVRGYRIYRARAQEPWKTKFTPIARTTKTTHLDTDLSPGTVYFYTVRAIGADGVEGPPSFRARTQPRVPGPPLVSVLGTDRVEIRWDAHPAPDVIGYNLYRGIVTIRTVTRGIPKPWRDNDPEYAAPQPVEVRNLTRIRKLNDRPLTETTFLDRVDLREKGPESADYRYAVHAYLVRAVNRLGVESGPSPYALTIPAEPTQVLNRETADGTANLKWDASREKGVVGYHVYKLEGTWNIVRLTTEPIRTTTFTHKGGKNPTRYWIVAVDRLGQEGQPSSPVWHNQRYHGFFPGDWHQ